MAAGGGSPSGSVTLYEGEGTYSIVTQHDPTQFALMMFDCQGDSHHTIRNPHVGTNLENDHSGFAVEITYAGSAWWLDITWSQPALKITGYYTYP